MNKKINTVYFSATGTTEKIIWGIADYLISIDKKIIKNNINFTLPKTRQQQLNFTEEDIVIIDCLAINDKQLFRILYTTNKEVTPIAYLKEIYFYHRTFLKLRHCPECGKDKKYF